MMHIAIDPGKSGGVAYTSAGRLCGIKMPDSPATVVNLLRQLRATNDTLVIEQLPKFVGKAIPSSTTAVLFENFGITIGAAIALGYRLERVDPHAWQKGLGIGTGRQCKNKGEWKRKLKSKAEELFPGTEVTLATADAMLIWDYYRKTSEVPRE